MPTAEITGCRVTTCRSCGEEIIFAPHWGAPQGRLMPIDARPAEGGNLAVIDGVYVIVRDRGNAQRWQDSLHLSHFVTCPKATQHRRR